MILPIYAYGSRVLRKVSEDLDRDYEGLEELISNMFETMYKSEGVGLAAPQIGQNINMFIIDTSPMQEDDPEMADFKKIFINPRIIKEFGEEWLYNEGCLSVPGIREDVKRKNTITISYYDENFNHFEETYDGIKARVIQHEYDHLLGKVFTDYVSILRKRLLKGKLMNISKGITDITYKMNFPMK